jgi:alkyl sulfatase BDS1-like metallo-beta-lactamase superfamily hydrolase
VPGIYQLRGFDLSVMSVIEGDEGVVVIDPLISKETAAAAFALYRSVRGDRPIRAVIYTHSHIDHFGGVKGIVSQPDVEAYFPDHRALCAAENTSHTLHNILTLRGAVVRDAHDWAHYLTETIGLWGDDLDVVFASHHWPTWGRERAVEFLAAQRDMYLYLHDQTLRLINQGYVGTEIAEMLEMPPELEATWHTHGYYGSVSHNVKAIYQRYLGWYEGNPARLWRHPPEAAGRRYVAAMGGAEAAVAVARMAYHDGDLR